MRMLTLLLVMGLAVLLARPDIGIHLSRYVVPLGQTVEITCTVTPDTRNRVLRFGFDDNYSARQLDGANARITWGPFPFRPTCESGPAFCIADRNTKGEFVIAKTPITVANCEEGH